MSTMTMTTDLRPEPQDMLMMRGATFAQPYAFTDDDDGPINTTGWTLEGSIDVLGAVIEAPLAFTFADRNDVAGTGTIKIAGFEALAVGSYYYHVSFADSLGTKNCAARGAIRISDEAP